MTDRPDDADDDLRLPLDGDAGPPAPDTDAQAEPETSPDPETAREPREDPRAELPSLTLLLNRTPAQDAIASFGRETYLGALRATLDLARVAVEGGGPVPSAGTVHDRAIARLEAVAPAGTARVLNATGVVLHTDLGRAPMSASATSALAEAAGTVDVEYDLATGHHSPRGSAVAEELASIGGADAGFVVNNAAAALVVVVAALARGREVVVSRGELAELDDGCRIRDLLVVGGATVREVGATNRTHLRDYQDAIGPDTAMLLRIHPSTYRIEGGADRPSPADLAEVAREAGVPFVQDVGRGLLRAAPELGADEPSVVEALADGADVVLFSGDELLGGPQAGILLGRADLIETCRREPLARTMQVDKSRLAALEATAAVHRRGTLTELPTWAMLRADAAGLFDRARSWVAALDAELADTEGATVEVVEVEGRVGGDALFGTVLRSHGVAVTSEAGAGELAARLRRTDPPVIGRVVQDRVILDPRTVPPDRDDQLLAAVRAALTT